MTKIDLNAGDHVVVKCIGDYLGFTIGNTYEAELFNREGEGLS